MPILCFQLESFILSLTHFISSNCWLTQWMIIGKKWWSLFCNASFMTSTFFPYKRVSILKFSSFLIMSSLLDSFFDFLWLCKRFKIHSNLWMEISSSWISSSVMKSSSKAWFLMKWPVPSSPDSFPMAMQIYLIFVRGFP